MSELTLTERDLQPITSKQKFGGSIRFSGDSMLKAVSRNPDQLYFVCYFKAIYKLLDESKMNHHAFQSFRELHELPEAAKSMLRAGKYKVAMSNEKASESELWTMHQYYQEHGEWPQTKGNVDFAEIFGVKSSSEEQPTKVEESTEVNQLTQDFPF